MVVSLEPTLPFMKRCGMGTSTREAAKILWGERLPDGDPTQLMRELYHKENAERKDPSGSQDMAGIIYPGISRLDYDARVEGGFFPAHITSCHDPQVTRWLEKVLYILPVGQRPEGYHPLGQINLNLTWIERLGRTGMDCYDAIIEKNAKKLGASMNETMQCWEKILPHTVKHPTIKTDLVKLLHFFQNKYHGAMYSGCGGGYFYIIASEPIPGTFKINVRLNNKGQS